MAKALFTISIFTSAFLLFLVQPMFARMMLPYLGGSPAVWNTALVFYQATLLLGYAYAHWASRNLIGKRVWIHVGLLVLGFLLLPLRVPLMGEPPRSGSPVLWLLGMLALGVGIPFFLTSTTSPLLQRWFSHLGHRQSGNPYFLYAASNVGSLAALLGYPFLIELSLDLPDQSRLWSFCFVALALLAASCAYLFSKVKPAEATNEPVPVEEVTSKRKWRWVLLAFVPSALLMGMTTFLTTEVAAVPLLWVGPLAIYLLTFVFTFADRRLIPHKFVVGVAPFFIVLTLVVTVGQFKENYGLAVILALVGFFFSSMMCHGELSKNKPEPARLTEFFLWVSFGGVLGGLFCGLVAPIIFRQVLEYPLAMVLCAALVPAFSKAKSGWDLLLPIATVVAGAAGLIWLRDQNHWLDWDAWKAMLVPGALCVLSFARPVRLAASVAALCIVPIFFGPMSTNRLYQSRGFFGTLIVRERNSMHQLSHGTTLHGQQSTDPTLALKPSSYYHESGPCGDFLVHRPIPPGGKVAVVGLGVGTLLAYSKPGQEWTVFEIDPEVVKVSTNPAYFTYLENAKGKWRIELGDARLSLARSRDQFDVMMFDAYSSDAVPIHLITREAFEVYLQRLKPGGLIAVHISNRYMDLWPVLSSVAKDLGLVERRREDDDFNAASFPGKAGSEWVVLVRSQADLGPLLIDMNWSQDPVPVGFQTWTDGKSSILTVLKNSPWNPARNH